jgi:hypothetical protein
LLIVGLAGSLGCGGPEPTMPATYPVTGKVVSEDGKPMTGGVISFQSIADPSLTMSGDIQFDGTFTLRTFQGDTQVPGIPPGDYQVSVMPLAGDQATSPPVEPILLPKKYTVKPGENNFTITLPPPKRTS